MADLAGAESVCALEAVESFGAAAAKNSCKSQIMTVKWPVHSTSLSPTGSPLSRYSLAVGELLDSQLIGEGVLQSMRHAARCLLTPGASVVPHSTAVPDPMQIHAD